MAASDLVYEYNATVGNIKAETLTNQLYDWLT